jgi:hypothetical protein
MARLSINFFDRLTFLPLSFRTSSLNIRSLLMAEDERFIDVRIIQSSTLFESGTMLFEVRAVVSGIDIEDEIGGELGRLNMLTPRQ